MVTRPDRLLRLEALLVLLAALLCFAVVLHGNWLLFALAFLLPDLSLLGYLAKNHLRFAAGLYNAIHSYALPIVLALGAWHGIVPYATQLAIIWMAHIAFDRMLGFGLKYPEAFKPTHIQTVAVFPATEPVTAA